MILALACLAAVVAAVIQRVTGLAFVLVLIGPVVLVYGPAAARVLMLSCAWIGVAVVMTRALLELIGSPPSG